MFQADQGCFWANHLLVSASSTSGHGFWIRNVQPLGEDIGGTFWRGNSSQSTWSYTSWRELPMWKAWSVRYQMPKSSCFWKCCPLSRTPLGKINQTRLVPFSDRLIYNLHGERWTVTLDPTKNGSGSPEINFDPPVPDQLVAQKNIAKSPFRPVRVPSCPSFWASSKTNKIQLKDPKFLKPRHQNWSRNLQIRFKKIRCSLKKLKKTDPWIPVLPSYPFVKHGRKIPQQCFDGIYILAINIEQTTYLLDVPIKSIEHLHLSWWFPTTLTFFPTF